MRHPYKSKNIQYVPPEVKLLQLQQQLVLSLLQSSCVWSAVIS